LIKKELKIDFFAFLKNIVKQKKTLLRAFF